MDTQARHVLRRIMEIWDTPAEDRRAESAKAWFVQNLSIQPAIVLAQLRSEINDAEIQTALLSCVQTAVQHYRSQPFADVNLSVSELELSTFAHLAISLLLGANLPFPVDLAQDVVVAFPVRDWYLLVRELIEQRLTAAQVLARILVSLHSTDREAIYNSVRAILYYQGYVAHIGELGEVNRLVAEIAFALGQVQSRHPSLQGEIHAAQTRLLRWLDPPESW